METYILPADLIESGHDFNSEPIGTGPYKLVAWNRGESLEFEAFEDYFGGAAPIKHITWRIIPEGSSRTMALEAGEVDLIIEVETADATRIAETDGLTLLQRAWYLPQLYDDQQRELLRSTILISVKHLLPPSIRKRLYRWP